MDNIKVTMPEIQNISGTIRNYNTQLDDILSNCLATMNELSSVWQSEGAETIIERFKKFSSRFTLESDTIEEYCKFLDLTAQSYDSIESTITSNASSFE